MCMAPTGSAAALIGGSTYHSMLGLRQNASSDSVATLLQVRARLQNVEYMFIDEISAWLTVEVCILFVQRCVQH